MRRNLVRFLILVGAIVFYSQCFRYIHIETANEKSPVPISFSNLPFPARAKFREKLLVRYKPASHQALNQDAVYDTLVQKVKETPGGLGIKNLRIRVYSQSWQAAQFFNLYGFWVGIFGTTGFTWKTLLIEGEVF